MIAHNFIFDYACLFWWVCNLSFFFVLKKNTDGALAIKTTSKFEYFFNFKSYWITNMALNISWIFLVEVNMILHLLQMSEWKRRIVIILMNLKFCTCMSFEEIIGSPSCIVTSKIFAWQ